MLTTTRLALRDDRAKAIPPIRSEPVDLPALLEKAAARPRSAHPERRVQTSITGGLPIVQADPVLLRRVVDNLLENAHKYTEDVTQPILLEAKLAAPSLVIEVRDRGMGIAAPAARAEDVQRGRGRPVRQAADAGAGRT